jgi:hypothetical protein
LNSVPLTLPCGVSRDGEQLVQLIDVIFRRVASAWDSPENSSQILFEHLRSCREFQVLGRAYEEHQPSRHPAR